MPKDWEHLQDDVATFKSLETVFSNILNIAIRLAGIILFVMLVAGGFNYLTSGGNPERAKKASGTITWAVAGFILLIASWFILRFLGQFTGVDLTQFELPGT